MMGEAVDLFMDRIILLNLFTQGLDTFFEISNNSRQLIRIMRLYFYEGYP